MSIATRGIILGLMLSLFVLHNNVSVEGLAVNWGTITSHPLPPTEVVKLLQNDGFNKVKLFDSNPRILKALAGSGIEVMTAIPNLDLKTMADPAKAKAWVEQNVTSYKITSKDGVKITNVAVGNEPFLKDYKDQFVNVTFPALKNIQEALNDAGVGKIVKATIPFNADVYESPTSNPVPSAGVFRPDVADTVMEILEYMNKNKAPFVVNIYPFLSVAYSEGEFPIEFAFFDGKSSPLVDGSIQYTNVFDAMIDTLASALSTAGYKDMPIVVGEIGWPTDGDVNANVSVAERFYNGIIPKILSNKGTPLRPGNIEVYMFALFDENLKSILPGNFERSWGIYRYDGRPKFPLVLSTSKGQNKTLSSVDIPYLPKQWCVLKPGAGNKEKAISDALAYACDRTDCMPVMNGSSCGDLSSSDNASYIFNSFYQDQNQTAESCGFDGLATITKKDPSTPNCNFTIQLALKSFDISPSPAPTSSDGKSGDDDNSPPGTHSGGIIPSMPRLWVFSIITLLPLLIPQM